MTKRNMLDGMPGKKPELSDEEVLGRLERPIGDQKKKAKTGPKTENPREGKEFKRMNIYVPVELHKRFKINAAIIDRSMNDICIELLRDYMEKVETNK